MKRPPEWALDRIANEMELRDGQLLWIDTSPTNGRGKRKTNPIGHIAHGSRDGPTMLTATIRNLSDVGNQDIVLSCRDIAWFLSKEEWPKYPVFQLDRNPYNLDPDNLAQKNAPGTTFARIGLNGPLWTATATVYLGNFKSEKEAKDAVEKWWAANPKFRPSPGMRDL